MDPNIPGSSHSDGTFLFLFNFTSRCNIIIVMYKTIMLLLVMGGGDLHFTGFLSPFPILCHVIT